MQKNAPSGERPQRRKRARVTRSGGFADWLGRSNQAGFGPRKSIGFHILVSAGWSAVLALEIVSNVSSIAFMSPWPVKPPAARPSVVHSKIQPLLPPSRASIQVHRSSQVLARRTNPRPELRCLSVMSMRSVRRPSVSSNTRSHSTECVLCFSARDRRRRPSSTSASQV